MLIYLILSQHTTLKNCRLSGLTGDACRIWQPLLALQMPFVPLICKHNVLLFRLYIKNIHSKYYLDYNTDKNDTFLDGPMQINRERMSTACYCECIVGPSYYITMCLFSSFCVFIISWLLYFLAYYTVGLGLLYFYWR